jgi:hypothetical protein
LPSSPRSNSPLFAWVVEGALETAAADAPARLAGSPPDARLLPLEEPEPTRLRARVQGFDPLGRAWTDRPGFPGSTLHSRLKESFAGRAFLFLGDASPWKVAELALEDGPDGSFLAVRLRRVDASPRTDLAGALERLRRGRPPAPAFPLASPVGTVVLDADVLAAAYLRSVPLAETLAQLWRDQRGAVAQPSLVEFSAMASGTDLDLPAILADLSRHLRVVLPSAATAAEAVGISRRTGLTIAEAAVLAVARQADAVELLSLRLPGGREIEGVRVTRPDS